MMYPADWPRCPACGDFAMDGHITCGRLECREGWHRDTLLTVWAWKCRFCGHANRGTDSSLFCEKCETPR